MREVSRPPHAGKRAVVGLATIALISGFSAVSASTTAASASAAPRFAALADSVPAITDHRIGSYSSSHMSIEVSLAPSHPAALASDLRAAYTKGSRGYHQWLRRGQFDATFAPSGGERAAVVRYLRGQGLSVGRSSSPFLIRASGSSGRIETAFRTSLSRFRGQKASATSPTPPPFTCPLPSPAACSA
jgi:subtilase family serine protease